MNKIDIKSIQNTKFAIGYTLASFVLVIICCILLSKYEMRIEEVNLDDIGMITENDGALFSLEEAHFDHNIIDPDHLFLEGWFAIRGREPDNIKMHLALRNNYTGEFFLLPTAIISRSDITEYIGEEINHDISGFRCDLEYDDSFAIEEIPHELMVLYSIDGEEYVYDTLYSTKDFSIIEE